MPGMDRWREALELLLTRAHASKRGVERQGLAAQEQFVRWRRSPRGPSVHILERLIYGLGLTWTDWGEICDALRATESTESKARGRHQPGGVLKKGGGKNTYLRVHKHSA